MSAGVRNIRADIRKILEEPETAERESRGLAMRKEIRRAQKRHDQFTQRSAQNRDGVAKPSEKEMAALMNNQIDVIDKQKAAVVRRGINQKQNINRDPRDSRVSRNRLPLPKIVFQNCHEESVASAQADRYRLQMCRCRNDSIIPKARNSNSQRNNAASGEPSPEHRRPRQAVARFRSGRPTRECWPANSRSAIYP